MFMKFVIIIIFLLFIFSAPSFAKQGSCGENSHWVRAHHRRAYTRYDGTYVSATNVRAHCQGNPPGYAFWRPRLKDDRPADWPHKNEITKKWTDEETERMVEALGSIPKVLWENSNINFYRMDNSSTVLGNESTYGKNMVVFYDSAFDSKKNLARLLSHELSHDQFDKLTETEKLDYENLNGWYSVLDNKTEVWKNINNKFVEPDGSFSPSEDFANNMEYFLFDPVKLKMISPNAYGWIKQHYGDKLKIMKGNN